MKLKSKVKPDNINTGEYFSEELSIQCVYLCRHELLIKLLRKMVYSNLPVFCLPVISVRSLATKEMVSYLILLIALRSRLPTLYRL